eukprot:g16120.t1
MGLTFTKIWGRLLGVKERKIVMVGLDAAGKTTVLYRLKLNEVLMTIPTIGFNVETVEYRNLRLTVWDIGGQDIIRPLWRHYFLGTHAMIFVVDSSDHKRMQEAREELWTMLKEPDFTPQAPVLILANKQDLPDAMSAKEVTEQLGLSELRGRAFHVQPSSAPKGEGLFEGLLVMKGATHAVLKLNEVLMTIPTIGFNVETVEYRNIRFTVWDIGGQDKIRPLWKYYFLGTHAVIFVLDNPELAQAACLIMANKQDLPDAMSTKEVTEQLGLADLRFRKIHVQPTSAPKGEGIYEGDTFTAQKPAFGGRSFSGLPEFAAQEAGWNDRHHEYFSIFLEPRDKRVVPKRQNGITRHFFPYRLPGEPDGRDDPETPAEMMLKSWAQKDRNHETLDISGQAESGFDEFGWVWRDFFHSQGR